MTRTEGTGRGKYPKEPVLKICPRTGNARFAEQARKCSDLWPDQGLSQVRPSKVESRMPGQKPSKNVDMT
jgi:hypothetical protein